jgi:hypothetical protein
VSSDVWHAFAIARTGASDAGVAAHHGATSGAGINSSVANMLRARLRPVARRADRAASNGVLAREVSDLVCDREPDRAGIRDSRRDDDPSATADLDHPCCRSIEIVERDLGADRRSDPLDVDVAWSGDADCGEGLNCCRLDLLLTGRRVFAGYVRRDQRRVVQDVHVHREHLSTTLGRGCAENDAGVGGREDSRFVAEDRSAHITVDPPSQCRRRSR